MRVILWILLGVVVLAGAALAWLAIRSPEQRPPSAEKVEATPERLARGEYLTLHVTHCLGCHSDLHADRFAIPIKAGTEGQGGFLFDKKLGVPGLVQAQNITSDPETGLGGWTDGEVLRAMREGVDRKGQALFPMMPYEGYREMSDDDARAIVAYVRTLKPIRHEVAPKRIDFPVNLLVKFAPKPVTSRIETPTAKDGLAYGKYLATIAGCRDLPHADREGKTDSRHGVHGRLAVRRALGTRGQPRTSRRTPTTTWARRPATSSSGASSPSRALTETTRRSRRPDATR